MIQYTTPTFLFDINVPENVIDNIEVTFKQANTGVEIQKELVKDRLAIIDNKLNVHLSESETGKFSVGSCQVQMRVLTTDGKVLASEIARIKVEPSLSDDVLIEGGSDGEDSSYDAGYADGYYKGVEYGKAEGREEGKAEGIEEGKSIGYADGYSKGEEAGFESGKDEGFKSGYSDGFVSGESHGYEKGYADGSKGDVDTVDLNLHLTSNGTFIYEKPEDKYYGEISVKVDVEERLPEQEKEITITENGEATVTPDDGFALNLVRVITDVPEPLPEQEKVLDIIDNGSYEVVPDEGFALSKVTVNANVGGSDELVKIKTFNIEEFADNNTGNFTSLIKNIDWTEFNKLKTTNFSSFFANYQGKYIDLKNLDTSNATNMYGMFSRAERIVTIDFGTFDTSKVTTMESMFSVSNFSEVDKLSNWDVSKVTTVRSMFSSCRNFSSIDLTKWITSSLTSTNQMFYQNSNNLKTVNLSGWDTTKLTDMYGMFSYSNYLETVNLSGWDTSKVTSINIFDNCYNLKNVTFGNNWASNPNVTSISYSSCPFTKDTILDLANKIADKSDTSVYTGTYTVKLKSSQKNVFTSDEQTTLANLFTSKNWTLSWG